MSTYLLVIMEDNKLKSNYQVQKDVSLRGKSQKIFGLCVFGKKTFG